MKLRESESASLQYFLAKYRGTFGLLLAPELAKVLYNIVLGEYKSGTKLVHSISSFEIKLGSILEKFIPNFKKEFIEVETTDEDIVVEEPKYIPSFNLCFFNNGTTVVQVMMNPQFMNELLKVMDSYGERVGNYPAQIKGLCDLIEDQLEYYVSQGHIDAA